MVSGFGLAGFGLRFMLCWGYSTFGRLFMGKIFLPKTNATRNLPTRNLKNGKCMASMAGDKAHYFEFCQMNYVPLHLQPWWLDAVCGGGANWQIALAVNKGGEVTGALPYFSTRRWGLPVVQMPPFTAYAGPVLRYPPQSTFKESSWPAIEHKVLAELIGQLPRVAYFVQHFRPEVTDWLPFYWAGFQQTTRYTYILPDTADLSALYAGLKNTVRTDLKTAARYTAAVQEHDSELVFRLNAM